MKTVNYFIIRIIMCSGLFLNATAQDDLVGMYLPSNFETSIDYCVNETALEDNDELSYTDASLETDNSWIESTERVSITELPKSIMKTLVDEYNVYAVLKAEEVKTSVRMAYKITIEKNSELWDILLNKKGQIILEEKVNS